MPSHQEMTLFEKVRRIKKCGLVEENTSLGMCFEILKAHTPSPELLSLSVEQDTALSYCSSSGHACCHAPAMMMIN